MNFTTKNNTNFTAVEVTARYKLEHTGVLVEQNTKVCVVANFFLGMCPCEKRSEQS